ncbi:UNVERIFIED_CONTAM: hypothetical protein PYX00_003721 [Menopon gallinae]|uniref:G-protein coupled receptors family 1 profile domain-containing protein n=1 Tax=Menopon gallinae TaxID=328185 RepID=A0AAW2I2S3_9NEOP
MDLFNGSSSDYDDNCTYPLSSLNFLPDFNVTDIPRLELDWPCEVRTYWVQISPFVGAVKFLLTYVTTIIIIIGVTMNTLSFLILNSPPISHTSLSVFLRALAVSDNGALLFNFATGVGRSHIPSFSRLYLESVWLCGANKVLVDVFLFYSTWLVVGLTVKRLLVIGCPMKSSFKCTVKTAKRIVYIIGLTSFSIALLKLRYSGYEQDSTFGFKPCKFTPANSDNKVVYVYIALSTWLPCLLIFIGNILLIRQVRLSNKARYELSADKGAVKRFNETHRMLGLLITVSVTTLVLMFPLGIVETFELYWDFVLIKKPSPQGPANQQYIKWQQEKLLLKWVRGLFFSIYQWAFSTNFFLYCLTGRKFRTAAKNYFRNCARNPCWKLKFVSGSVTRLRHQLTKLTRSTRSTTEIEMESRNNNRKIDSPEMRNEEKSS